MTGSLLKISFDAKVSNSLFSEKMCRAGDDPAAVGSGGEGFGDGGPAAVGDGKLGSGSVCDDSDLLPRLRALLCRAATADMEEDDPSASGGVGGDADIVEDDWLVGLSAAVVLLLLVLTK